MARRQRGYGKQLGFALFELIVAVLITTLLAVWASDALVRRAHEASAEAVAAWMEGVKGGVATYLVRHAESLRAAVSESDLSGQGYADWRAPTLPELKQDGVLSAGYPEIYGRDLRVAARVIRRGVCPGDECSIEAIIYVMSALDVAVSGHRNESILASWLMAAKGQGGMVTHADTTRVAGASFSYTNPPDPVMPLLPAGTVALAINQTGAASFPYLKVGDTRDPQFASALSVSGVISSGTALRSQSNLWLGQQAIEQTSCPENGLVVREQFGGLLVCRSYLWRSAGGKGGGGFSVNSVTGCVAMAANPRTGTCTCPTGYSTVLVSDSGPKADATGRTVGYLCVG